MKFREQVVVIGIVGFITLIANFITFNLYPTAKMQGIGILDGIPGILILALICIAGILIAQVLPGKIPAVAYIVTLSTILTIPGVPFAKEVSYYTGKINFITLCTPILAYAGIYTGANLDGLKKTGPKIVILSIFVMVGTYIGSALIAELILRIIGLI